MGSTDTSDERGKEAGATYRYLIDAKDRILEVDDAWLRFAEENDAPGLTRDAVVGKSLWDFISDLETRMLYEALLARVRQEQPRVSVAFRCDSPSVRRFMELDIISAGASRISFVGHLLRAETRQPVSLLDTRVARGDAVLTLCGWCKKVELSSVEWVEVEEAVTRLDLFGKLPLPAISHGICPACSERFHSGLRAM